MSGAFTAQMEAEDAAVFERLIEVTPGDYLFTACVYRPRAIRFCVSQEVEVH
jgi:hypothetical protein